MLSLPFSWLRCLAALLALFHLIPGTALTPPPRDPPALVITSDTGAVLPYTVGLNLWNGAVYDRLPTLGMYYEEHKGKSIPQVPLNGTIQLTFQGDPPDGCTFYDLAYRTEDPRHIIPLVFQGNTATFRVPSLPDAATPQPGQAPKPREFLLVCGWGENVCEYGFALVSTP